MQVSEEFSISIVNGTSGTTITCVGVLDVMPSERLREAVDSIVDQGAISVVLDCSRVTLITSAGITALVDTAITCQEQTIALEFIMSKHVRRILDRVGLWWLGVIDDGIAVHGALQRALKNYADQSFAGTLNQVRPETNEKQPPDPDPENDDDSVSTDVDEQSEESFPASDPPSYRSKEN